MVFRVSMEDIRIRRFVELEKAKVGDTVNVSFLGIVDVENHNLIDRVYDISHAYIQGTKCGQIEKAYSIEGISISPSDNSEKAMKSADLCLKKRGGYQSYFAIRLSGR